MYGEESEVTYYCYDDTGLNKYKVYFVKICVNIFQLFKEDVEVIWNIYSWLLMAYGGDSFGVGMVAVLENTLF